LPEPVNQHSISSKAHWLSLKNGDADALQKLYTLYSNSLYNYGSKFTPDKDLIKECIQELFVNLWTRRTFIGNPADVKNYLFKAFRLSVFKKAALLKKHQVYQEAENYPFHITLSAEDELITGEKNEELTKRIEAALGQLTDRQKEAVFLKFYENLSYDEIAVIMDISVKATYKLMARSLGFLRENLSKDDLLLLITLFYIKIYH